MGWKCLYFLESEGYKNVSILSIDWYDMDRVLGAGLGPSKDLRSSWSHGHSYIYDWGDALEEEEWTLTGGRRPQEDDRKYSRYMSHTYKIPSRSASSHLRLWNFITPRCSLIRLIAGMISYYNHIEQRDYLMRNYFNLWWTLKTLLQWIWATYNQSWKLEQQNTSKEKNFPSIRVSKSKQVKKIWWSSMLISQRKARESRSI